MAIRTQSQTAMRCFRSGTSIAFLAALVLTPPAAAQTPSAGSGQAWPARPLRMIVSDAAGTVPDLAARVLGDGLSRALGQPVRVENRPGDDGVQVAASAAPSGYNWFFAPSSALTIFPYTTDLLPYSPEDDFAGVALVGYAPFVVVANPELNVKSLPDLIALAREAPGRRAVASPGLRSLRGILGEMIRKRADLKLMPVPYPGPQSARETIAGRTHFSVETVPAVSIAVERRQLRALAVSSAKRLPEMKDVATIAEVLPGFEFSAWYALVAPAGTPEAIIERVNREASRLLADPGTSDRLNLLGIYPEGASPPAQLDAFFASERAFWRKTARELKMEP
jgi:tripartite-type tricarboxylate transporter receptor subunit TctC